MNQHSVGWHSLALNVRQDTLRFLGSGPSSGSPEAQYCFLRELPNGRFTMLSTITSRLAGRQRSLLKRQFDLVRIAICRSKDFSDGMRGFDARKR